MCPSWRIDPDTGRTDRVKHHRLTTLGRDATRSTAEVRAAAKQAVADLGWEGPARWLRVSTKTAAGFALRGASKSSMPAWSK